MQKMVLLSYDRYQRLMTSHENDSNTTQSDRREPEEQTVTRVEDKVHIDPEVEGEVASGKELSSNIEKVIPLFPKSVRGRAHALLTYIAPYVSWDDTLEVTVSGVKIPHSNIVDLIKVHLKEYKDFCPVGAEKFGELLKNINAPQSLLTRSRRNQGGRGRQIPPPPGIPAKRKTYETDTVKVKWLKL